MMRNNQPAIYTRESLQREQRRLKLIIQEQENELRQRVQKLPGELLHAGAAAILPAVLTGKITDKILNAGKNLVNKAFTKKTDRPGSRLAAAAKQAGVFTLLKIAYNAVIKRK